MSNKPIKFDADSVKVEVENSSDNLSATLDLDPSASKSLPAEQGLNLKKSEKKSKLGRNFLYGALAIVVAGASYELWGFTQSLFGIHSILGWSMVALSSITAASGIGFWFRARSQSKRLESREKMQLELKSLVEQNTYGKVEPILDEINEQVLPHVNISKNIAIYNATKQNSHQDNDLLQIYNQQVLTGLDKLAMDIISKHASESAVMVALSPLAAADMALVTWRSSKMLQEISRVYGCPQSVFGRLGLTKQVLQNLMLAGATELIADAGVELVGKSLTATISGKVAQGIGIGVLISRLGIQTIKLCRPMEFEQGQAPKLSQLRKLISSKVLGLVVTKKDKQENLENKEEKS